MCGRLTAKLAGLLSQLIHRERSEINSSEPLSTGQAKNGERITASQGGVRLRDHPVVRVVV